MHGYETCLRWTVCSVCLDGCAARRVEQVVETGQPVAEHQTDREGKGGPCPVLWLHSGPSLPKLHT